MKVTINTDRFLADPKKYFSDSYNQFVAFGGPCVYFHLECLRAGETFLSERHIEMLYATLTAWGMHRMGDSEKTKTKLKDWKRFRASLIDQATPLQKFRCYHMLEMSETEYSDEVLRLRPYYEALDLSESDATIVVNSKALHHLFPDFIPPIDRQYTIRFFRWAPKEWRDAKGKFKTITLPKSAEGQFDLFHETCVDIKRLSDQIGPVLFEDERRRYNVTAPKAIDNAIVNFVRIVSGR
ncbi:MAG: hypothetical protein HY283_09580 [Nitrospirae bacterium]|nr:hypothetical protein [Nitrospirota bacterium]